MIAQIVVEEAGDTYYFRFQASDRDVHSFAYTLTQQDLHETVSEVLYPFIVEKAIRALVVDNIPMKHWKDLTIRFVKTLLGDFEPKYLPEWVFTETFMLHSSVTVHSETLVKYL